MTKKIMIQAFDAPKYTHLINALFWINSKVYLTDNDQSSLLRDVEIPRKYILGDKVKLLGLETPEETMQKYKKYLTCEVDRKRFLGTASEEEKRAVAEFEDVCKKIDKQAWHKLDKVWADLYRFIADKKIRLYGLKVADNTKKEENVSEDQYETVGFTLISPDDITLQQVDLKTETLHQEDTDYYDLNVSTEDLFKNFPPEDENLNTSQPFTLTTKSFVVDPVFIKDNKNLGGRPKVLSEEDTVRIVKYVMDRGGYKWLAEKGTLNKVKIIECKQDNNLLVSDETIRRLFDIIKKVFKPSEK